MGTQALVCLPRGGKGTGQGKDLYVHLDWAGDGPEAVGETIRKRDSGDERIVDGRH